LIRSITTPIFHNSQRLVVFGLVIVLNTLPIFGQRNLSAQAQKAVDDFNNKEYSTASTEFKLLVEQYPKDLLYQYYLGASLIESNASVLQAISYLKAASVNEACYKSFYYLGKAYYRQFEFENSKDAFTEFKKRAKWQENNALDISSELTKLESSSGFFSKAIPISAKSSVNTNKDSVLQTISHSLDINILNISSIGNNTSVYYVLSTENTIQTGKYYYYSASTNMGLRGKDIFRIKKLPDGNWTTPENLGFTINTFEDEDYPFFDYQTTTLYFASKGHKSFGGFDIFKSKYDSLKNEWAKPEQMPFPINTQWDDFLWINLGTNQIFISNRSSLAGQATIYFLNKSPENNTVELHTNNDMFQALNLGISGNEAAPIYKTKKANNTINNSFTHKQESNSTFTEQITKALYNQSRADSLLLFARQKKGILINTEGKEKRASLYSEIARYEKQATKYQKIANDIYAQIAASDSKPNLTSTSVNKVKVNNTQPAKFTINNTSPYSKDNPFSDNNKLPDGIVYRIQLGVFSKQVAFDFFGGLQPITFELMSDNKIIKYYVGIFSNFEQADKSMKKVKELGFREAFIVAYFNNHKIPVERAKEMELSEN